MLDIVSAGFRRDVNEVFDLLGCYAALLGNYLLMFRDNLPNRLSRNVGKYEITLRNISQERRPSFGHPCWASDLFYARKLFVWKSVEKL